MKKWLSWGGHYRAPPSLILLSTSSKPSSSALKLTGSSKSSTQTPNHSEIHSSQNWKLRFKSLKFLKLKGGGTRRAYGEEVETPLRLRRRRHQARRSFQKKCKNGGGRSRREKEKSCDENQRGKDKDAF